MNATTLRPVIASTASENRSRIATWNTCRVCLTASCSPASISVRSTGV
jgi:hypothetical protein